MGKINVEAEKNELILENEFGDKVIIPAKKRQWVQKQIEKGNHADLDNYISTLPIKSDFAEEGSVVPGDPTKKVKVYTGKPEYFVQGVAPRNGERKNEDGSVSTHSMSYTSADDVHYAYPTLFQDGDKWIQLDDKDDWAAFKEAQKRKELFKFDNEEDAKKFAEGSWKTENIKEYDIDSPEYRELYNSGAIANYDKNSDTYILSKPLDEVVITAEAPQWAKDKRKYESQYTKDWYIDNNMPKFSRSMGISANNMHSNNVKQYEEFINNKVAESILKRHPKVGTSANDRLEWYNSLSEKERDIVNNSYSADKFSPAVRTYMENQSNEAKKYGILETFRDADKLAQSVEGTPERFRIFPNAENNIENSVNPLMWIGDMAKGLGNIPKDIKKGNYLKAAGSVASPLLGGALGGLGAKTTGQFVKNTFLPLGGLEENIVKGGKNLIDATKAGSKVLNKTDDVVKNASLIPNWTVPKIKSVEEIDKLDNLHPVFKTFDKDTWKEIAKKKGNDYFLDRFNKKLVDVTNDLNSYENLAINISDYPQLIEGKKWSEDFIKSPEWKQRVKNANPDLTDEQINNLQKSTLLSMPSNMKTFIKNQASKNSFHGGQFTVDDLIHGRNVAFRYFTPEEVLDHPLHFKSLASHEFGHSQSTMRKLPNDKSWHQPLEESGDMMKTNDTYKGDGYVELSEEKRSRSIPSYMFAKENNLLENGEFTEKTYDILKNMAEKDWKSVPNDFNSILQWYDKKSAINYLNKFYATIPFYLYLQSQQQNKTEQ